MVVIFINFILLSNLTLWTHKSVRRPMHSVKSDVKINAASKFVNDLLQLKVTFRPRCSSRCTTSHCLAVGYSCSLQITEDISHYY